MYHTESVNLVVARLLKYHDVDYLFPTVEDIRVADTIIGHCQNEGEYRFLHIL